jgi:hypothetical protein
LDRPFFTQVAVAVQDIELLEMERLAREAAAVAEMLK